MADEFADKLNAVLGNPEAMGQIMSLARSLTGDSGRWTHGVWIPSIKDSTAISHARFQYSSARFFLDHGWTKRQWKVSCRIMRFT